MLEPKTPFFPLPLAGEASPRGNKSKCPTAKVTVMIDKRILTNHRNSVGMMGVLSGMMEGAAQWHWQEHGSSPRRSGAKCPPIKSPEKKMAPRRTESMHVTLRARATLSEPICYEQEIGLFVYNIKSFTHKRTKHVLKLPDFSVPYFTRKQWIRDSHYTTTNYVF